MKKYIIILLLLVTPFIHSQARALEISAGPAVWYAWWSPYFKNYFMQKFTGSARTFESAAYLALFGRQRWNESGSFLYGPAVSVKFSEKWSFSSVFTASSPYSQSGGFAQYVYGSVFMSQYISLRMQKYDLDAALSYAALPNFKFFAGIKYQGYNYRSRPRGTFRTSYSTSWAADLYDYRADSDAVGAGIGAGATFRMAGDLFLVFNVSGVYLRPHVDWSEKASTIGFAALNRQNQRYNALGVNGNVSLAYYIPAASVTVTGGFRFQALKMYCMKIVNSQYGSSTALDQVVRENLRIEFLSRNLFDKTSDYFYGASLTVTYGFSI